MTPTPESLADAIAAMLARDGYAMVTRPEDLEELRARIRMEIEMKAMEIPRQDLRRARAMQFCAAISDVLRDYIPEAVRRDAHYALLDMLYKSGVDTVTDADRASAGLPPRDGLGWTADELRIIEAFKLEAMQRPFKNMFMPERAP